MSIVNSIEEIRDWLEAEVCPLVQLKIPDDTATDASYSYHLVNPAAFSLFVPTKDRLPPKIPAPIPSVCVQLIEGEDQLIQSHREIKVRLCFSAWDPGIHAPNLFVSCDKNEGCSSFFQKDGGGWRDAWNFVDITLRLVENSDYIGGLRVMREQGISFGPVTEQDAIPDFYPYWFAWMEFYVEEALTRNPRSYNHLL